MTPRTRTTSLVLLPSALLLSACAQGAMSVSPGTVLSAVILAGEAIGGSGRSSGSSGGGSNTSSRTRSLPRSPAPSAVASRVLSAADEQVGVKYTWGGNTPQSGFDCSGLTKFVFARQGIQLPRTAREQARAGQAVPIDFDKVLPGDILLFAEPGEAISHVAIYVGSGELIHSSSAYHGVNYLDLNTSRGDWYLQNLVAIRRLTSNGRSLVQSLATLTIKGLAPDLPKSW
ncbi:MAG: C40 family peptidase [Gemmatimonadaceae bacterium]